MNFFHFAKKITLVFSFVLLLSSFHSQQDAFAKESNTVYDAYKTDKATKTTNISKEDQTIGENSSLVPQLIKFFFSFASIIILLLLVLKFLKAKSKHIDSRGPFYTMGGHSLGGNRSLQLVMIGKTLYILGIGNEVRLLKTIESGEEQDFILQSMAEETEQKQKPKLFSFLKKNAGPSSEDWEQTFLYQMNQVDQPSIPINKLKD
ncbi:flagellar biosynthetic protein FliO [Neobacillus drentensis]|uniref:flagellar biosynthetic protein FliO n=1 Tax=Neobacillus drentensis TaxID=220684 RepID=UPI00300397FD